MLTLGFRPRSQFIRVAEFAASAVCSGSAKVQKAPAAVNTLEPIALYFLVSRKAGLPTL